MAIVKLVRNQSVKIVKPQTFVNIRELIKELEEKEPEQLGIGRPNEQLVFQFKIDGRVAMGLCLFYYCGESI